MIKLPNLPYAMDALSPFIDTKTVETHYTKHHQGYVNNTNDLIAGTEFENLSLEQIIQKSSDGPIFNNSAQVWNHTFYRDSMTPNATQKNPIGQTSSLILQQWSNIEAFKDEFANKAKTNFGSGRTWLVVSDDGKLEIVNTSNANTPFRNGKKCLLTLDVWEHAYYLDYQNRRPKYISKRFELINREKVEERFVG